MEYSKEYRYISVMKQIIIYESGGEKLIIQQEMRTCIYLRKLNLKFWLGSGLL